MVTTVEKARDGRVLPGAPARREDMRSGSVYQAVVDWSRQVCAVLFRVLSCAPAMGEEVVPGQMPPKA